MNKLIKPFELIKPQLEHIIFVGTKEFLNKHLKLPIPENFCSLRRKDDVCRSHGILYCNHIRHCHMCFYNAKNYLNVLKYRKKLLNE